MLYRSRARLRQIGKSVRRHLIWVFLLFGIGFTLTLVYRVEAFAFLLAPAQGGLSPIEGRPVFITPTEMLGSTVQLAMMGGFIFAAPVITLGIFRLMSHSFMPWERRSLLLFFPTVLVLYATGIFFAYFVFLPTGLRFLLNFGTDIATPTIRISEYLSLVTRMMLWLGLVFELPIIMFVTTRFRVVSFSRFVSLNKYVPAAALTFGAIITPSFDLVSMALVAGPLIFLYEIGLFLAWMARPSQDAPSSSLHRLLRKVKSVLIFLSVALLLPALMIGAWYLWYIGVIQL